MLNLQIGHKILRGIVVCLCLLGIVACSSQPESTLSARDLELDIKLWNVYTKVHAVRLDVEDTFKHKKLTPKEAELCFQRNKATLDSLAAELKEIQRSQEGGYSDQVQELIQAVDSALSIAKSTYLEKHLTDLQGAKEVLQALKSLSKDIPRQRVRQLLQKGCTTQQIYELFRGSGVSERDIQQFILQARAEEQTKTASAPTTTNGDEERTDNALNAAPIDTSAAQMLNSPASDPISQRQGQSGSVPAATPGNHHEEKP